MLRRASKTKTGLPDGNSSEGAEDNRHVPIKRHSTFKRLSWISRRSKDNQSLAIGLPNEVLLMIFRQVKRMRLDPSTVGMRPRDDIRLFPLICKAWYGAATRVFYEVIEFPRVAAVTKFHRSLVERPHLQGLVKELYLPARMGRTCPPHLFKVFLQIINLIENLEGLHSMCAVETDYRWGKDTPSAEGRYILPIAPSRHTELKSLTLYVENMRHWCIFPSILVSSFQYLESLSLHGFYISDEVSQEKTPILPNLTSISVRSGDCLRKMDRWMLAHPHLEQLSIKRQEIYDTPTENIPLALLREGSIKQLELHTSTIYDPEQNWHPYQWLSNCTLKELRISWRLFQGHYQYMPSILDIMGVHIEYWEFEEFSLEPFEGLFKKTLVTDEFVITTCKHHKQFALNRKRLEGLFEEAGVKLKVEFMKCWCGPAIARATQDVFFPIVHWGWGQCRRLTKQQTVETIEWEWPHMK